MTKSEARFIVDQSSLQNAVRSVLRMLIDALPDERSTFTTEQLQYLLNGEIARGYLYTPCAVCGEYIDGRTEKWLRDRVGEGDVYYHTRCDPKKAAEPQAEPDMPTEIWAGVDDEQAGIVQVWSRARLEFCPHHYISYDEHERLMEELRHAFGEMHKRLMEEAQQERDVMISAARAEEQDIAEEKHEVEMREWMSALAKHDPDVLVQLLKSNGHEKEAVAFDEAWKRIERARDPEPCPTCAKVRTWCENEVDVYFNHTDIYQAHTILDILGEAVKVQPRDPMACPVPGCTGTMRAFAESRGYRVGCDANPQHPQSGGVHDTPLSAESVWHRWMSGKEVNDA